MKLATLNVNIYEALCFVGMRDGVMGEWWRSVGEGGECLRYAHRFTAHRQTHVARAIQAICFFPSLAREARSSFYAIFYWLYASDTLHLSCVVASVGLENPPYIVHCSPDLYDIFMESASRLYFR
jgi:hypothetical protein